MIVEVDLARYMAETTQRGNAKALPQVARRVKKLRSPECAYAWMPLDRTPEDETHSLCATKQNSKQRSP